MVMTAKEMAESYEELPILGTSLSVGTVSHLHFYCILFFLCVGGCSCYRTHVEVRAQLVELLLFFKD